MNGTVTMSLKDYDALRLEVATKMSKIAQLEDTVQALHEENQEVVAMRDKLFLDKLDTKCSWWFEFNEEANRVTWKSWYEDDVKKLLKDGYPAYVIDQYLDICTKQYFEREAEKAAEAAAKAAELEAKGQEVLNDAIVK